MCPSNDGVEDTEHYLLLCQSYDEPSQWAPSDISNLSNELLVIFILYRNERLPPEVNKRLIEATLKFIHTTKRF